MRLRIRTYAEPPVAPRPQVTPWPDEDPALAVGQERVLTEDVRGRGSYKEFNDVCWFAHRFALRIISNEGRRPMIHGADSRSTRPRLLFFYDPADARARRVESYLAQVLQKRRNHTSFAVRRVAISGRPDLAQRFRVQSPSLVVVDGNQIRGRLYQPR